MYFNLIFNLILTPNGTFAGWGMYKTTLTPILTLFLKLCNSFSFLFLVFSFIPVLFKVLLKVLYISTMYSARARVTDYL